MQQARILEASVCILMGIYWIVPKLWRAIQLTWVKAVADRGNEMWWDQNGTGQQGDH